MFLTKFDTEHKIKDDAGNTHMVAGVIAISQTSIDKLASLLNKEDGKVHIDTTGDVGFILRAIVRHCHESTLKGSK